MLAVFTHCSLIQTLESVWENSQVCVNTCHGGSGFHKLSRSRKLPLVFASGYVSAAHIIYFLSV